MKCSHCHTFAILYTVNFWNRLLQTESALKVLPLTHFYSILLIYTSILKQKFMMTLSPIQNLLIRLYFCVGIVDFRNSAVGLHLVQSIFNLFISMLCLAGLKTISSSQSVR